MLTTRNSGPDHPISVKSTTTIATKLLLSFAFVIAVASVATLAKAQNQPNVTLQGTTYSCPIIVNGQQTGWVAGTTCQNATVLNCPNADDLTFTFGYESPAGTTYKGSIVILNGAGGTTPNDDIGQPLAVGPYYLQQGYEIVQLA